MTTSRPSFYAALAAALLLGAVACSSGVNSASAQTAPPATERALGMERDGQATPEERADRQVMYLTERLTLRENQVAPTRAIALEFAERRQDMRAQSGSDRRTQMQAMRGLQTEQSDRFEALLDEGQFAEYEKMQKELRDQMKAKFRERRANGQGGRRRRG